MKAKEPHRVPLSAPALALIKTLKEQKQHETLVFPSPCEQVLSDMTLTALLRRVKARSDTPGRVATAHGFGSSFRDWASEHGYARADYRYSSISIVPPIDSITERISSGTSGTRLPDGLNQKQESRTFAPACCTIFARPSRGKPRRLTRYRKCGVSKSLCTASSLLTPHRPLFPNALLALPDGRLNGRPLMIVVSGDT
jgi:hypothetical protein